MELTYSQAVNRLEEIGAEMERLAEKAELTPEDETYLDELRAEFDEVDQHRAAVKVKAEKARQAAILEALRDGRAKATPGAGPSARSRAEFDRDAILEPDSIEDHRFRNPWDLSEVRTFGRDHDELVGEYRARALDAIEKMPGASDNIRQAGTQILENFGDPRGHLAQLILGISAPAYMRAFAKLARDPNQPQLSNEENQAIAQVRSLQRAMSLTDSEGGYLVPFQLDPAVILTSDGSYNEIRQIARRVVATGDTWNGVSSAAVSWSFDIESSEVSDDATTFAQPSITIRSARGFVPISIEARQDAANVTMEVGRLLAQGKDDLEATKFISGSAVSNEPIGIITALGSGRDQASATTDTFAMADVYATRNGVAARYRRRGSWLANLGFYDLVRQAVSVDSEYSDPVGDTPGRLLGRPTYEAEEMDGVVNATQDNRLAIFGDFSNYVIADRVGTTVDFIPHLFGSNNRPTGQSGWFAHYRVGADSVNDSAFKVYNVT